MAVADIQGAFLHANMDDETHMLLEGKITELIVKLDPKLLLESSHYGCLTVFIRLLITLTISFKSYF